MIITPFAYMATQEDADAIAYINAVSTAGGTLSAAQETAINTFFTTLKGDGVYDKLHFFHPFLGGTANSNAIEGKSPGGDYDITFNGTWSHSATGSYCAQAAGNYADTNFNPSTEAEVTSNFGFGVITLGVSGLAGGYSGLGNADATAIFIGPASNRTRLQYWYGNQSLNDPTSGANGNDGYFQAVNKDSTTTVNGYYILSGSDGNINTTANIGSATYTPYDATLWYGSNNGSDIEIGGEFRFGYGAESLDGTEIQNFADAINTLQTAFSRNLW